jgi:hypothetical protein
MLDSQKVLSGILNTRGLRCSECKNFFRPTPRLKSRQKTCAVRKCQLKHRARYRKQYRNKNSGPEKEYQEKSKANRSAQFWKEYRASHPESSERNRMFARLRKKLKRAGLQRQLDIVQVLDPPGYFEHFAEFAMSHRSLVCACQARHAA